MNKILVNEKYAYLKGFIESIPTRILHEGTVLYVQRNLIHELVTPDGLHLNVKRYHKPFFFNNLVYSSGIRKPKGLRAYEYPFLLAQKGIDTPESIAYIEERKWGLLQYTYFVSVQLPYKQVADIIDAPAGTYTDLILSLAAFTAHMHEQGVLHKDYSPGNILFQQETDGMYKFSIVDINRMRFGQVDMQTGCRNFARLWGPKHFTITLVREYARLRGFNPDESERIALEARTQFWERFQKKYTVKYSLEL